MTTFDREKEFEEKCQPVLDELRRLCAIENIPFYFTACVKNDEDESVYISDGILTGARSIELKDDRMKKHLLVGLGFDVIPSRDEFEIDMDSFGDM